jgi:hypothetical protein
LVAGKTNLPAMTKYTMPVMTTVERSTTIQPQMALGVLTTKEHLDAFVQGFHLDLSECL